MSSEFTTNLSLELPDFNVATWHDAVNNDFRIIDMAISGATYRAAWQNNHAYAINDQVIDTTTLTVYQCLVAHTSAVAGTFAADRAAHPTFWVQLVTSNPNLVSVDPSSLPGPDFNLSRDSPSPAAFDNIGRIFFRGRDSVGNVQDYATIKAGIDSPTNGNEFGTMTFGICIGGIISDFLGFSGTAGSATFYGTGPLNVNGILNTIGQISFPIAQNPSSDANTLDDYEEGTYTPTINGTTIVGVGTYSVQGGTYSKIGNRVLFDLQLTWTAHTGTGNMLIGGQPFVCAVNTTCSIYYSSLTYTSPPVCLIGNGLTTILLRTNASGAVDTDIAMDTAARLLVSGHYKTT